MNGKLFLLLSCGLLAAWQCAAIAPPSGGPKDTTPPELISADPPSETVRLLDQTIELHFSEYMGEQSFIKGIRFSPFLEGEHHVSFKGDRVFITFPEGVKNEMTVVMTLSRDIKDEHGVEMAKAVQLAYSTGDEIDHGVIRGKVYGESVSAVYLFHDDHGDSLLLGRPNYIAETEDDGSFEFNFLASGKYKILTVERGVTGLQLDPKRMSYGLPFFSGIELDSIYTGVRMRLFKEEEPLRLLSGEWKDWNWGKLHFNNEFVEGMAIQGLNIGGQEMEWFGHPDDEKAIIVTVSDTIQREKEKISFEKIVMDHSVLLDSSGVNVSIPAAGDTNYLTLVTPASKLAVTPDQSGPPVELVFSRPLGDRLLTNLKIDLMIDDTTMVNYKYMILSPMKIAVIPQNGWEPKQSYQLKLFRHETSSIKETFKDSVITIKIETTRPQGYGGFSGSVKGYDSGNLITHIKSVENNEWNFKSVVNSERRFEYNNIPESSYIFFVFDDRDQNTEYSHGSAFPFEPSEWFYVLPDTIEIRANWDIEYQPILMDK
ncbi:MAG: hypothetical protein CMG29_01140 [Candidatus Marinimicrobia bacterium]|jgi:hypothetical protein|nr:hypothetical protein [Candidatus Neomarinimicrobiota bacterium]|tara:strand:- start:6714 stop:8339 length:1626 start_codon:yes stop_codon:yes gene_type:complete